MQTRWGSKLGFIIATAGSAVGLGNIWRFPYLVGQNGGAAFILLYLLCIAFLGLFMLTAKLSFGHLVHTNLFDAFNKACPSASKWWGCACGTLSLLNVLLVFSIYAIVIGWTLSYVVKSFQFLIGSEPFVLDDQIFQHLTGSFTTQLLYAFICIVITSFVLLKGVRKGIEKASLIMMPMLFLLLLVMAIWILCLPESRDGFQYLFNPNWGQLGFEESGFNARVFGQLFFNVLGQAIFSLSMGMGTVFIYGAYAGANMNIKKSAFWIVILDTFVALLAAIIVLPPLFAFHMELTQGPGLSFISLPMIFSQIVGGQVFMLLFFVLLFLAALTSIISLYEPLIIILNEKLDCSRFKATIVVALTNVILTSIVLLSQTAHWSIDLFGLFDKITGSYTLSLMVGLCCIFMGWKIFPELLTALPTVSKLYKGYLKFVLRFLAPVIMFFLIIETLF